MAIKCLRIHYQLNDDSYEVFDRCGSYYRKVNHAISIKDLPALAYFGFCPIDTMDITLTFKQPLSEARLNKAIQNSGKGQPKLSEV